MAPNRTNNRDVVIVPSPPPISDSQIARIRLRERWELASVLNFLRVFDPVIKSGLKVTAEEIETSLIMPNKDLADLHIAILKGIPPVSKVLPGTDAWVPLVRKKLSDWWKWLAEGENPLIANPGEEILRYKELDPTARLQILKALCELRAFQNDAIRYVNDAIKEGTEVSVFRKESTGEDKKGTAYWYDGDSTIGHRLYKEITKVEFVKMKGKGRLTQPTNSYQWETLATNLEEFQQISEKFSCNKIPVGADIMKMVDTEIIPVLEEIQKKKERALKKQQRQAVRLTSCLNSYQAARTRSCRDRKPVSYTFDDFDRSIDEAIDEGKVIQLDTRRKTTHDKNREGEGKGIVFNGVFENNGLIESDAKKDDFNEDNKLRGAGGGDDSDDADYYGKGDEDDNKDDENESISDDSEKENNNAGNVRRLTRGSQKRKALVEKDITGLRRSSRLPSHPETNKLRKKSSPNTSNDQVMLTSDSDEGTVSDNTEDEIMDSNEKGSRADLDGLLEVSGEDDSENEEDHFSENENEEDDSLKSEEDNDA
ncbi:hypothetical protein GIB67_035415 [Kingdonia uniflora]|uniref:DDT domain-containing protein DDR4 n=1 Tax=Kingdonia uniflora TaxID=39325 RepID=A0A7J7P0B1_9MAGN|nr:hypothetical protein GIB67_035415 [Kingdonia uniflora]